ncbi:MAG: acyl-ACP--UDP-N-acetylglucosamine O-acyltransferase [Bdellovibrionales bacterium]
MTNSIHPTAIVEPGVTLGSNVVIGPYCVLQGPVKIGDNVELKSHVVIEGHTTIGAGTRIYSFAVLGAPTPDRKYKGEAAELIIGKNNVIREYVTMHPGTAADKMKTVVGDNNLILERVHIAHDCVIGNNVTLVNSVGISGHVTIEDFVTIGGMTGVTQHVRIGHHAFIGAHVKLEEDVIPYGLVRGDHGYLDGVNIIGMQRQNMTDANIKAARKAYLYIFNRAEGTTFAERVEEAAKEYANTPAVMEIIEFIRNRERALCQPRALAA